MNRNLIIALLCLFVFNGCDNHGLISRSDVKMIKAVRYRAGTDTITKTFTSASQIDHIIDGLNNNKKETIAFTNLDCDIRIIYKDSTVNILGFGNTIKYKGATYLLNSSLEALLY